MTLETESGLINQEVSATLVIRGNLASGEIVPKVVSLASGERIQFRAVAYDENRVLLPDVFFRWSVANSDPGSIDSSGLFAAKGGIGEYPAAVQRSRVPAP